MIIPVGITVTYIDVQGIERRLTCIERLDGVVKWRRGHSYSGVARYRCEDEHIIQVPNDAWSLVKVIKEDRDERI